MSEFGSYEPEWQTDRVVDAYEQSDARARKLKRVNQRPDYYGSNDLVPASPRYDGLSAVVSGNSEYARLVQMRVVLVELEAKLAQIRLDHMATLTRQRVAYLLELGQQILPLLDDPETHPLVRLGAEQAFGAWLNSAQMIVGGW